MEVQTRSDNVRGLHCGTKHWRSVAEAYQAWTEDRSIWKISWEGKRFLFTRPSCNKKGGSFDIELASICSDYATARATAPNAVFWYREDLISRQVIEVLRDIDFRAIYGLSG